MLYALFAMVLLTLTTGMLALRARIASVRTRQIDIGFFRLMQARIDQSVPERVVATTRCFNNMFEVPALFYAVGILAIATDRATPFTVVAAWLFVGCRAAQAWIHLTGNAIRARMIAFLLGIVLVLALWIEQLLLAS